MVSTNTTEGNKAIRTDPAQSAGPQVPETKGVLLQARGVTIRTREGVSLLSDISFHVEPGDLVALTGLSRSGKSTLLQSLAGLVKPASGEILLDGIDLYSNLKAFRSTIGFVPAKFALQPNLTVAEILQEAAILRLPRRASSQERERRLSTLLQTTGLAQMRDQRVGLLSPFEKRKLSIAVELLGSPGILLLDKSAEPLTPFEEIQVTILLRELARQGLTVIQVDERSRSAGLSDKVIFLGPNGLLAWFGPPDEASIYLRSLLPRGVAKDLFGLREALEILGNPQAQEGIDWAKRFKDNDAYQKYVDDPLHDRYPDLMLQTHPLIRIRLKNSSQEKTPPASIARASSIQKFILLIRRNFRVLWRDRTVIPMLVIPPLVALLDLLLSSSAALSPDRAPTIFGLLVFVVMLTSALLVQNEIFKERAVYQRENRTSPLLFSYILSKVWLVGILAIYQGLVWTIIHVAATGMAAGLQALVPYAITIFLVALIGGILGLIVSSFSRTGMMTSWLLLLTVPQLILSGAIMPLATLSFVFNFLSPLNPSRYALDSLLAIGGYGQGLNGTLFSDWLILAILSLGLVLLLMGIQRRAADART